MEKIITKVNALLEKGIENVPADEVIATSNELIRALGGTPRFNNQEEFDRLMMSDKPIVL